MFFTKEIRELIDKKDRTLAEEVTKLWNENKMLRDKLDSLIGDSGSKDITRLISRIEELEIWRAKIHSLLTYTTVAGNEKLSKEGKFIALQYNKK